MYAADSHPNCRGKFSQRRRAEDAVSQIHAYGPALKICLHFPRYGKFCAARNRHLAISLPSDPKIVRVAGDHRGDEKMPSQRTGRGKSICTHEASQGLTELPNGLSVQDAADLVREPIRVERLAKEAVEPGRFALFI